MQVETDYNYNLFAENVARDKLVVRGGGDLAQNSRGTDSPEYKAIANKAAMLLSNSNLSPSEKTRILNLLARAKAAAESGATGQLSTLLNEMKNLDPALTRKEDGFSGGNPEPKGAAKTKAEEKVRYQDQSSDIGVSMSYPVSMNQYQAPLAVRAHEGEHVMIARAKALMNNQNVTTYVSIHHGYDGRGRLITTGGTTIVKTSPQREMVSLRIGNKIDLNA